MNKFLIKNIIIFIFAIFLSANLLSEELILPKPQPKIEKLTKEEKILPKSQPNVEQLPKKKTLFPKIKPKLDDKTKLQIKQKKFVLPKKKPEDQITKEIKVTKTKKESSEEKIITKVRR